MIKFNWNQSFQGMALVRLADTLWNSVRMMVISKIEHLEPNETPSFIQDLWGEMLNIVKGKILALHLPESLTVELERYAIGIGSQIFQWIIIHKNIPCLEIKLPKTFCWTSVGTIDESRTAELLVMDETLGTKERFRLACMYCLESSVHYLTEQSKKNDIKIDVDGQNNHGQGLHDRENTSAVTFPSIIDEWQVQWAGMRPGSFVNFEVVFGIAADKGNKAAVKYFWERLNPETREMTLKKTAYCLAKVLFNPVVRCFLYCSRPHADVLHFLFSLMTSEQQKKVLQRYPCGFLKSFLYWPWQDRFLEIAELLWDYLDAKDYSYLLKHISELACKKEFKDYDYHKLLLDFLNEAPVPHRQYLIEECARGGLLLHLLRLNGSFQKHIEFLFQHMTPEIKKVFICSKPGWLACHSLLENNNIDSLENVFKACLTTRKTLAEFTTHVHGLISRDRNHIYKWDQLKLHTERFTSCYDETEAGGHPAKKSRLT